MHLQESAGGSYPTSSLTFPLVARQVQIDPQSLACQRRFLDGVGRGIQGCGCATYEASWIR